MAPPLALRRQALPVCRAPRWAVQGRLVVRRGGVPAAVAAPLRGAFPIAAATTRRPVAVPTPAPRRAVAVPTAPPRRPVPTAHLFRRCVPERAGGGGSPRRQPAAPVHGRCVEG